MTETQKYLWQVVVDWKNREVGKIGGPYSIKFGKPPLNVMQARLTVARANKIIVAWEKTQRAKYEARKKAIERTAWDLRGIILMEKPIAAKARVQKLIKSR